MLHNLLPLLDISEAPPFRQKSRIDEAISSVLLSLSLSTVCTKEVRSDKDLEKLSSLFPTLNFEALNCEIGQNKNKNLCWEISNLIVSPKGKMGHVPDLRPPPPPPPHMISE